MRLPKGLQKYADRVDAMSLRERVLIFLAATAMLIMFADSALFSPLLARQKANSLKIQQQEDEVRTMRLQLQAYSQAQVSNAAKAKRLRLEQRRAELAALERQMAASQRELVTPDRMAQLLTDILKRSPEIELVALRTLAASGLAPAQGGASEGPTVYRHGVEITMAGSYLQLLRYVSQLERFPVRLFWGGMDVQSAYPKITLKLTVFTLSTEKTWLVI
jgi:MSHA biogenesis protein MshJ